MSGYDLAQLLIAIAYTVAGFTLGVLSVGIYITIRLRQIGYYSWGEVEDLFLHLIYSDVVAKVSYRRKQGILPANEDWANLYWFLKMAAHFLPAENRRRVQDHLEAILHSYGLPMSFLDDGDYRRANDAVEGTKTPWPMAQPKSPSKEVVPSLLERFMGKISSWRPRQVLPWIWLSAIILLGLTQLMPAKDWLFWVAKPFYGLLAINLLLSPYACATRSGVRLGDFKQLRGYT